MIVNQRVAATLNNLIRVVPFGVDENSDSSLWFHVLFLYLQESVVWIALNF